MADHTETIQIDFDPSVISYADLLRVFFETHNACAQAWSRQYMSAIFFADESQKKAAEGAAANVAKAAGQSVETAILPLDTFWRAEDYHQKYYLRRYRDVASALRRLFPDEASFIDSKAAMRANAFIGQDASADIVQSDIERLGLDPKMTEALRAHALRER